MLWIFLAITAHLFWAVGNVGDKYILGNKIKDPYFYLILSFIVNSVALAFIPFVKFYIPELKLIILIALAAMLNFVSGFGYIKAIQIEEVTRINIWWNMIPIFTLFIGWATIGQKLTNIQIFALIILIGGAVIGSIHLCEKKIALSKAVWLMIASCFLLSVYAIIFSYLSRFIPFVVIFIWLNIFICLYVLAFFAQQKFRAGFAQNIKQLNKKLIMIIVFLSLLNITATFFNVWALSLGIAALVFAMEGFQVIFVFSIAVLISFFNPKILKEDLSYKNILLKLIALVCMVAGIAILAFN